MTNLREQLTVKYLIRRDVYLVASARARLTFFQSFQNFVVFVEQLDFCHVTDISSDS